MITDCGSFLTEFAATGQPIIRLVNPENKQPYPPLYDTYYNMHNNDELKATLRKVLEKGIGGQRQLRTIWACARRPHGKGIAHESATMGLG